EPVAQGLLVVTLRAHRFARERQPILSGLERLASDPLHDRELGVAAARAVAGLARHSLRLGIGRTEALRRLAVSRDVAGQAHGSFLWVGDALLLRHRLGLVGAQRLE